MSYQALLFCQDEKTARTVTQVLSELEFQVEPCAETFAAVKKLTSQTFEAVVVDCQNEENASLLLKTARNSVSNQQSLMVALVEGQAGVASAFRIGANLVLTKPIAIEQARGTLRVARGLLRKNAGTPSTTSSGATPTAPSSVPAKTAPSVPSAPLAAPAFVATPTFAPPAAKAAQASIPTVSAPAAPRPIAPPLPSPPRATPAPPPALRATASSNLESESEIQPQPDAASAGLLEALDFKTFEPAQPPAFAHSGQEVVSVSELNTGAHEAVRAALTPRAPMSSQEFSAGFGSAAAAAPAKERPAPAAPAMSAQVAELFEAPVFGQTMAPPAVTEEPAPYSPELDLSGAPTASRSKTPLIAVAAIFVLGGALYFGWSQMHKPTAATTPVAGPLQPPPPDFGAADAGNQPAPAAPSHGAPAAATEPDPAAQAPAETINRFSRSQKVAEDRVTTPIAVVSPHTSAVQPAPVQPSGQAPLRVKTELQHAQASSASADPTPEAPAIATLGGTSKPEALSAIAHSAATPLPAAPSAQRISQGVSEGLLIKRVQPVYPQQALQMHIQGVVQLQATVGKDGSVRNVKVISGPATLARAASDAVRQWKYRPYLLNGEPVETQTDININFVPPR